MLVAQIGETWILRRRNGSEIRLTLGCGNDGSHRWFYPGTMKLYSGGDTVGLLRKAPA